MVVGAVVTLTPFAEPQTPLIGGGGGAVFEAEQLAVVPPLLPVQDQAHGPVPVTVCAVPVWQRLVVGIVATVVPFAAPQVPLIGVGAGATTTFTDWLAVPPVLLVQVKV